MKHRFKSNFIITDRYVVYYESENSSTEYLVSSSGFTTQNIDKAILFPDEISAKITIHFLIKYFGFKLEYKYKPYKTKIVLAS